MAKEYATFIFDLEDLKLDKETELMIRDLTPGIRKYDARYVRAIISETQEKGGDKLWVRYGVGSYKVPNPYGLKIVQELGEYKGAVKKNK